MDAIDVEKAVEFVLSCRNFDGGFGSRPGSESHAGLIYCCVGVLSITGQVTFGFHYRRDVYILDAHFYMYMPSNNM